MVSCKSSRNQLFWFFCLQAPAPPPPPQKCEYTLGEEDDSGEFQFDDAFPQPPLPDGGAPAAAPSPAPLADSAPPPPAADPPQSPAEDPSTAAAPQVEAAAVPQQKPASPAAVQATDDDFDFMDDPPAVTSTPVAAPVKAALGAKAEPPKAPKTSAPIGDDEFDDFLNSLED